MARYEYGSLDQLSSALCTAVATNLRQAIAERGVAGLVLSGGRTPETYLPMLFSAPLAWQHVHITLSDERWVPPSHADSNEGLIRRLMPSHVADAVTFSGLWMDTATPEDAVNDVAERLTAMAQPFDAAILGMGEDGHFASLFPHTGAALSPAAQCLAITNAPAFARMSLSPARLTSITNIHLAILGKEKSTRLEQARQACDPDTLPVRLLMMPETLKKVSIHVAPSARDQT